MKLVKLVLTLPQAEELSFLAGNLLMDRVEYGKANGKRRLRIAEQAVTMLHEAILNAKR